MRGQVQRGRACLRVHHMLHQAAGCSCAPHPLAAGCQRGYQTSLLPSSPVWRPRPCPRTHKRSTLPARQRAPASRPMMTSAALKPCSDAGSPLAPEPVVGVRPHMAATTVLSASRRRTLRGEVWEVGWWGRGGERQVWGGGLKPGATRLGSSWLGSVFRGAIKREASCAQQLAAEAARGHPGERSPPHSQHPRVGNHLALEQLVPGGHL